MKIGRCCSVALQLSTQCGARFDGIVAACRQVGPMATFKLLWVVHIGALVIRVGLWDKLYCASKKEPPKS